MIHVFVQRAQNCRIRFQSRSQFNELGIPVYGGTRNGKNDPTDNLIPRLANFLSSDFNEAKNEMVKNRD